MNQEALLDALGAIDISYIDEAAPGQSPRKHRLGVWLSLAASLVLLVSLSALMLLRLSKPSLTQTELPAVVAEGTEKAGESRENTSESAVNVSRDEILAYQFGDLRLGMPQAQVQALLGEPAYVSKGSGIRSEDGIWRSMWYYELIDDDWNNYDLNIRFANAGDGYVVDKLWLWADNGLALPHGIKIGMSGDALLTLWPELASSQDDGASPYDGALMPRIHTLDGDALEGLTGGPMPDAVKEFNDSFSYQGTICYSQYAGDDLRFAVYLHQYSVLDPANSTEASLKSEVFAVTLGSFYPEPPADQTPDTTLAADYSFVGEPMPVSRSEDGKWIEIESHITIWHDVDGVWQPCELTDHDVWRMEDGIFRQVAWDTNPAKLLETLLSIEDLKPLSCATGPARYLIDFHNGTVVGLFDADDSGYIYHLEDRDAFALALAEGRLDPEAFTLTRIRGAVFPEGTWSLLEELTAS